MDRRDFLQLLALGLATASVGCSSVPSLIKHSTAKGRVFIFLEGADKVSSILRIYQWDDGQFRDFPIPLKTPHSILQSPNDRDELYIFESFGSCIKLHLKTQALIKIDHSTTKELFMGHAALSSSGQELLCTYSSARPDGRGVVIKSAKTLETLGFAPRECGVSHHVTALPNSNIFAFGNMVASDGGVGGGIVFFDYKKDRVIRKINLGYAVSHLFPISSTELIALGWRNGSIPLEKQNTIHYDQGDPQRMRDALKQSTFLEAPLVLAGLDGNYREIWDEPDRELLKFSFGLGAISGSKTFLTTHSASNSILLWQDLKVAKAVSADTPTSLVLSSDKSECMIACNGVAKVFSVSPFVELRTIAPPEKVIALAPCADA